MKHIFALFLIASLFCLISSAPADKEKLDKASANDPFVNDVIASNRAKLEEVSNGDHQPGSAPDFKPKPVGTGFVRLIDDIFQIPIGVLQSVARLLTNPFKQLHHGEHKDTNTSL